MTALPNPFMTTPAIPPQVAEILERAVAPALRGQLTPREVAWAKGHDWFVADLGSGLIQVIESWVNARTGEIGADVLVWDKSFSELCHWAGY